VTSPTSGGGCPVCGTVMGGATSCPNCGYNPVSIAAGGSPAAPQQAAGRSFRFAILATAFILLVGIGGFYVARYQREALRSIGAPIGLQHAVGTNLSPKECEERINHFLRGLFTAVGEPNSATETAALQNQAAEEFGVSTKEWRGLLEIYTSHAGIASIDSPKKAMRKAAADVRELCGADA
jgi:hypothetical protein